MKFVIDTDKLEESGLDGDVAMFLMSIYLGHPINADTYKKLAKTNYIYIEDSIGGIPQGLRLVNDGVHAIESLFLNSEITETTDSGEDRFMVLANKLRELFPSGRKPGTNNQWRDSAAIVCRRLKTLVKKFNISFTDEQAIDATKRYVESFHGITTYMQTLPYFIFKNIVVDGVREERSQFLSYLENSETDISDTWVNELR